MSSDEYLQPAEGVPANLQEPPLDHMFEDYLSSLSNGGFSLGGSEPIVWLPNTAMGGEDNLPLTPYCNLQGSAPAFDMGNHNRNSSDSQLSISQVSPFRTPAMTSLLEDGVKQGGVATSLSGTLHGSLAFSDMASMDLANILDINPPFSLAPSLEPVTDFAPQLRHQVDERETSGAQMNGLPPLLATNNQQGVANSALQFPAPENGMCLPLLDSFLGDPVGNFPAECLFSDVLVPTEGPDTALQHFDDSYYRQHLTSGSSPDQQKKVDGMVFNKSSNPSNLETYRTTSGSGISGGSQPYEGASLQAHNLQEETGRGLKKGKSKGEKSVRQQELNKLAQQRYRQKKKQIAEDTEKAADDLAEKAAEYNEMSRTCQAATEKNAALKQAIADRINELQNLKLQAKSQESCLPSPPPNVGPDDPPDSQKDAEDGRAQCRLGFQQIQNQIATLLPSGNPGPSLTSLPDPLSEKRLNLLSHLVQQALSLAKNAGIFSVRPVTQRTNEDSALEQHINQLVSGLFLAVPQIQQVISIRKQYNERLTTIMAERPKHNFNTMSALFNQGATPGGNQEQVANVNLKALFLRAKDSAHVADAVKGLKESLRLEHRVYTEMEFIVFNRILDALQSAHLVLNGYPERFDIMTVSSVVEKRFAGML